MNATDITTEMEMSPEWLPWSSLETLKTRFSVPSDDQSHPDALSASLPHKSSEHVDGLVQEKRNFSALAMELRLSCTNPSTWHYYLSNWREHISQNWMNTYYLTQIYASIRYITTDKERPRLRPHSLLSVYGCGFISLVFHANIFLSGIKRRCSTSRGGCVVEGPAVSQKHTGQSPTVQPWQAPSCSWTSPSTMSNRKRVCLVS